MGKAALFLAMAAVLGGSVMLLQTGRSSHDADLGQIERQEVMLAREIARSGFEAVHSKAYQVQRNAKNATMDQVLLLVNGADSVRGDFEGGKYVAWMEKASASAYILHAKGMYRNASHIISSTETLSSGTVKEETLQVPDSTILQIVFKESMAGYCSAVYLQKLPPKPQDNVNNGVDCGAIGKGGWKKGDIDKVIDDGKGGTLCSLPEMIFAPGKNRDGSGGKAGKANWANYETVIPPGWRLNFILAVDADYKCEREGENIPITDGMYDHWQDALTSDAGKLDEMKEGSFAMIQQNPYNSSLWRIAWEDQRKFDDAQLGDIKQNGYGSTKWDKKKKTYGGTGWTQMDVDGYWKLRDFGDIPDFSDQVIEIQMYTKGTILTPPVAQSGN